MLNTTLYKENKILNDRNFMYKQFDLWVKPLLQEGVIFFSLKITLCNFYKDGSKDPFLQDFKSLKIQLESINSSIRGVEFAECGFGSIEVTAEGVPILNCILGFRSNFNSINCTELQIESMLAIEQKDFTLKYLPELNNILEILHYISKDFDKSRPYPFGFISVFSRFFHYHHLHCLELPFFTLKFSFIENRTNFLYFSANNEQRWRGLTYRIKGISMHMKNKIYFEAVYYLAAYFLEFGFVFINNNVYKKIKGTAFSYNYQGNYSYIIKNFNLFMLELKDFRFLYSINIGRLSVLFIENSIKVITETKTLLDFSKKKLKLNLLEFKDSLYFGDYDILLAKPKRLLEIQENLINSYKGFITANFYKGFSKNILKKNLVPIFWKENTSFNFTEEEFKFLCLIFRNIIFLTDETSRKNILLGHTKKSPLIIDIAIKIWGSENIRGFSNDTKIMFNGINFIKTLFEEPTNERDYYKDLTYQILSSYVCSSVNLLLTNSALQLKIWRFIFNNECNLSQEQGNKVSEEIPKILVYCNRIHFEVTGKTLSKKSIKTTKNSILSLFKELPSQLDFSPVEENDPSFRL